MPYLTAPADLAFLVARGWQTGLPDDAKPGFELFRQLADKGGALPEGDTEGRAALRLLGDACLLHFRPSSRSQPFGVMSQFGDARSASIEDFGPDDVDLLAAAAAAAPQLPLRARLADVAWEAGKRCAHQRWEMGVLAARTYYQVSVVNLLDGDEMTGREALQRGLELTWQFRQQTQNLLDELWHLVETTARAAVDRPRLLILFADLCATRRPGLAPTLAPLLEQAAQREFAASGPSLQHSELWGRAALLWERASNAPAGQQARLNEAEALISHAEAGIASAMFASHWMKIGLEALRRARADPARVEAVHTRLLEVQQAITAQMASFEHEIDVRELHEHIGQAVSGKSFEQALFGMVQMDGLTDPDRIREQVLQLAHQNPLQATIPMERTNADGLTIARRGSLLFGPEQERADAVTAATFEHAARWDLHLRGEVMAPRAAQRIFDEHHPTEHDVARYVVGHPFIPVGFQAGVIRGLQAGFEADSFAVGTYLIPRMEGLIRHWLKRKGVVTSFVDDDGFQGERTLGQLLDLPEAEQYFGRALHFELRCHLIEKWGYDLRNKHAHALGSDGEIAGFATMSLWWLLWRILLTPLIARPGPPTEVAPLDQVAPPAEAGPAPTDNGATAPEA